MYPSVGFKKIDGSFYPSWTTKQFLSLIKNIVDFRGRTPKKLGMDWASEKTEYLALSALNVKSGYIDFSADPHYGDEDLYEKWMSGNELRKGQVLFTTEAPMGNVAQVPDDRPYILSQRTIAFDVDEKQIDEGFLAFLLLSPNVQVALSKLATGGTATGISQKSLAKLYVTIPSSIEEQEIIADFLSSVDEVISASEQEVANLEMQKKAVMKKIFSQEVRFKRDDGTDFPEWEESTIEDTCECLDNMRKPITKSDREPGPYPYYGSTNIQDYVAGYLFDEPLVLLAEDAGPFMEFWEKPIAQWAEGKIWVNNHAHVLRPSGNRKFMFYQLEHKDIREFINNPGRGKLNQEDMRRIVVGIPCLEEQRLIADFLSNFDEAIAAAKKELELWKELKKGLLQQMFV